MTRVSHALDRLEVTFDDPNLVSNAGLLLTATLADRLDLEALIDSTVKLGGRVGGARPGRKVLTLTHAIIAGATHIDHADMLRAGSTASVLGHRVMAPSTLGPFLRSDTSPARGGQRSSTRTGVGFECWTGRRVGDRHRLDDL